MLYVTYGDGNILLRERFPIYKLYLVCLYYLSSAEEGLLKKSKYNTRILKARLDD